MARCAPLCVDALTDMLHAPMTINCHSCATSMRHPRPLKMSTGCCYHNNTNDNHPMNFGVCLAMHSCGVTDFSFANTFCLWMTLIIPCHSTIQGSFHDAMQNNSGELPTTMMFATNDNDLKNKITIATDFQRSSVSFS